MNAPVPTAPAETELTAVANPRLSSAASTLAAAAVLPLQPTDPTQEPSSGGVVAEVVNPMHLPLASNRQIRRQVDPSLAIDRDQDQDLGDPPEDHDYYPTGETTTSPAGQRPRPTKRIRVRGHRESYTRSNKMSWCRPGNVAIVFFLLVILLYLLVLFVFHATSVVDEMVKSPRANMYLQVGPSTAFWISLLTGLLFLAALATLIRVTCCWRKLVDEAHHTIHSRSRAGATPTGVLVGGTLKDKGHHRRRHTARRLLRGLRCVLSPGLIFFSWKEAWVGATGPYMLVWEFLKECIELSLQIVAVFQLSEAGIHAEGIAFYVVVVFVNLTSPILSATHARGNHSLGLRTRRILLFDGCCDVFYGTFPLWMLLMRYFQLYLRDSSDRVHGASIGLCSNFTHEQFNCANVLKFMLIYQGGETFLGGQTVAESALKVLTRLLPIGFAIWRFQTAFLAAHFFDGIRASGRVAAATGVVASGGTRKGDKNGKDNKSNDSANASRGRSMSRDAESFLLSARRSVVDTLRSRPDEERENFYKEVPRWATGALVVTVLSFCLFVWIRLVILSRTCQSPVMRPVADGGLCAVRTFPVFSVGEADEECACNTIIAHPRSKCTTKEGMAEMHDVLWKKPDGIGKYVVVLVLNWCYFTNEVTESIIRNGRNIQILIMEKRFEPQFDGIGGDYSTPKPLGTSEERSLSFPLSLVKDHMPRLQVLNTRYFSQTGDIPSDFGRCLTSLKVLKQYGVPEIQNLGPLGDIPNLLELAVNAPGQHLSLPPSFARLTTLLELFIAAKGGSVRNLEQGLLHPGLLDVSVLHTSFAGAENSIPAVFGRMTDLNNLKLMYTSNIDNEPLPAHLSSQIDGEVSLVANRPALTTIPSAVFELTALNGLRLDRNSITDVPTDIGRLTRLEMIKLSWNPLVAGVDLPHLENLEKDHLKKVELIATNLTAVPAFLLFNPPIESLENVQLDWNQISSIPSGLLSGLAEYFSALSMDNNEVHSLPSDLTLATGPAKGPRLLFLHGNPVCDSLPNISNWRDQHAHGPRLWQVWCHQTRCAPECWGWTGAAILPHRWKSTESYYLGWSPFDDACQVSCNVSACNWDGGMCLVPGAEWDH